MHYSVVDLDGKTWESFSERSAAISALRAAVETDPSLTEELLVLATTDDGQPDGAGEMYLDLLPARVSLSHGPLVTAVVASGVLGTLSSAPGYLAKDQPRLVGRELSTLSFSGAPGYTAPATA